MIQADDQRKQEKVYIHPVDAQKAVYGKHETRRSISNVVRMVTKTYKYASLHELNAVLRQFNVTAYRGSERSQMFAKKGLLYSLIDAGGNRVGVPVKASAIYDKPTLAFLEKQFPLNEALRQPHKEALKKAVYKASQSPAVRSKQQLAKVLERQGISVVYRTNSDGRTYGITYVDYRRKTVFNGSSLGKSYSAKAVMEGLVVKGDDLVSRNSGQRCTNEPGPFHPDSKIDKNPKNGVGEAIREMLIPEARYAISPEAAMKLRKKKKRKNRRL